MAEEKEKPKLEDKYTLDKVKEPNKILLSNDTYAICDFLQDVKNKLEHLRVSALTK